MGSRKSMANIILDSKLHTSPTTSSPLRRKSVLPPRLQSSALSENDDEAERLARRREINITSTPSSSLTTPDRRRSLGLGLLVQVPAAQMAERITQCIKLGTENKINLKNAFSLEIIDFMTYMIKKQDSNMSNLQVASTSLDVSTKIYGYRVDSVHMEILKMMGGLDKQEKDNVSFDGSGEQTELQGDTESTSSQAKKKRKKNKQRIFGTLDSMKATVEIARPVPMMIGEADTQTIDTLCQVMLPNHANTGFYHHLFNDVLVDVVEPNGIQDQESGTDIPKVDDISELEICPPLCNFSFQDWMVDDEPAEAPPEEQNENRFQFDFDASRRNDDDDDDGGARSSMCYFNLDSDQENVDRCAKAPNNIENIVDFREVLTSTSTKTSEYSFIQKSLNIHWAGPSHWKVYNFKKALSNSRVVEVCQQGPIKKRKEIELLYTEDVKKPVENKFLPSQAVKLQAKTAKTDWTEERLTLPPDEHYDISSASKLYLQLLITIHKPDNKDLNATHLSEDLFDDYNYENENDSQDYCPDVANNDYPAGEENNPNEDGFRSEDDGVTSTQIPLTGYNLVAVPKLANKTSIAYCLKAKKIDMRQLKRTIWNSLISDNKENISIQEAVAQTAANKIKDQKRFSEVYKILPSKLSKSNAEALSFPISFVSLLHLANEKNLKVESLADMSDLIVRSD